MSAQRRFLRTVARAEAEKLGGKMGRPKVRGYLVRRGAPSVIESIREARLVEYRKRRAVEREHVEEVVRAARHLREDWRRPLPAKEGS